MPGGRTTVEHLSATGGTPPYRFYLVPEPGGPGVPSWLHLAADGTLTLEPPAGVAAVTLPVEVVDSNGRALGGELLSSSAHPSPLQSSRLRRILLAYTVNRLGSWIGLVALSLAVFDHTHSALAVAALLFAWQALPAFVVPAVVARVEASDRHSELSALYFIEAVATATLAVLLWQFWLPSVLLLAAIDGTAALAASALLRADVARTGREQLARLPDGSMQPEESIDPVEAQEAEQKANAALNVAFSISFVAGPIIGGVVVAAAGAPAALFIDVGSFLICGVLLIDLHRRIEEAHGDSVRARLRAAWTHVKDTPTLRGLLLAEAAALVFIEAGGPIEVAYVKATLNGGDRGYGLLVTTWGAGAVLGSVVFARIARRPLGVMLSAGTFALGAAFVGFAVAPSLARGVRGRANRRPRQWRRVALAHQPRAAADAAAAPRPPDGRRRVARRARAGGRPDAGRRARRAQLASGGVSDRGARRHGDHRRVRASDAHGARSRAPRGS